MRPALFHCDRAGVAFVALLAFSIPVHAEPKAPAIPDLTEATARVVDGTNALRREQHRREVVVNTKLSHAAQSFAEYMAASGKFSHEADGREPAGRARAAGYDYCLVLENIAYHFDTRGFGSTALARHILEGWKNSPGHRRNMMNADVTHVGVGIARGKQGGYYYSVQMLGLPHSASVRFEVRNESHANVRYRVGDAPYVVPGRSARTHDTCLHEKLVFERPAFEQGEALQPAAGQLFVVTPDARLLTR